MTEIPHDQVETFILSLPQAVLTYPFDEGTAVYKIGGEGKMFALVAEGKLPVNLSLKCDPVLAIKLREDFESVQPGYHLHKKHWNTLVLTGQIAWPEVQGLIRHSYDLVAGQSGAALG